MVLTHYTCIYRDFCMWCAYLSIWQIFTFWWPLTQYRQPHPEYTVSIVILSNVILSFMSACYWYILLFIRVLCFEKEINTWKRRKCLQAFIVPLSPTDLLSLSSHISLFPLFLVTSIGLRSIRAISEATCCNGSALSVRRIVPVCVCVCVRVCELCYIPLEYCSLRRCQHAFQFQTYLMDVDYLLLMVSC